MMGFLAKDYLKEKTAKIKTILKKHQIEKPLHLISWNTFSETHVLQMEHSFVLH